MDSLATGRINVRVPSEQKRHFERAAQAGGFRNLTDFILHAAQQKADVIMREHQTILASETDRLIFFQEITNPSSPNEKLRKAADRFEQQIAKL